MGYILEGLGLNIVQALVLLAFAPLIAGIINKVKAFLQKRQGASVLQEYFDLRKWWKKPTILTPHTSVIFILAPVAYFVTSFLAASMVPGFLAGQVSISDAFVFVYILALGRFFMTLSSMDAATSFGGMGGSREIYISVLVEPAVMLAILINSLRYHSTTLSSMVIDYDGAYFTVSAALACVAFFLVILAENSRLPVDNPDTHLELTMIHEGMTLEYSGPLLTLIHLGSMLKIMVFLTLFGALYLPLAVPLAVKILFGAVLIGVVEILNNKMRLFKVRVYLGAAIVLLLLAIIAE
ncbi:MAG: NADH-quinone oxidoreductase subunit H [Anaerovibrio sp.]|uniref:Hydrogenase n=2 Tax=Anaerovibrio slackiae TaxID=2652309 RepID=A0A6I2UEN8_9FIRM|nr:MULTISPECIES: NADH-quinone oxidoreductase subunit H [Anaerovibrio]MBQ2009457.1 NADH-quinone oxidoreductase subunit H [Selenomonadaceae bacterium]MBQ2411570.1 NADH-quinone oxidoreductase subunit H [Selenomonadaceae bacterium]MBQ5586296.1 NADH-quinone oxidoreductase subunit H [Selenomonadaceae bacterium]MBQ5651034.1 NADH-quinone oxidoreductase subunit H [Selenomonadaceae bacterium]MBQ5733607.1 NADH-quinone oxidoreductase subunit H [Selenomonadaceae bacterium]